MGIRIDRFSSALEGLEGLMESLDEAVIALEAGYCWQSLYDCLLDAGHDVRLRLQRVKTIAEAKVKTDKVTSETLAPYAGSWAAPRVVFARARCNTAEKGSLLLPE